MQPFVERYALSGDATDGPRPLACAFASVRAAIAAPGSRADAGHDMQRANAVLLLAGALDGNGAVGGIAATATLPVSRSALPQCAGVEPVDAFASAASIMADARAAPSEGLHGGAATPGSAILLPAGTEEKGATCVKHTR
jgi:hypothetical protein